MSSTDRSVLGSPPTDWRPALTISSSAAIRLSSRHVRFPPRGYPSGFRWALADPGRLLVYLLLTLARVLSLFPLSWLFVTSLSSQQFIVKVPPDLLPREITFQNYQRLFGTTPVVRWLANTLLMAGSI